MVVLRGTGTSKTLLRARVSTMATLRTSGGGGALAHAFAAAAAAAAATRTFATSTSKKTDVSGYASRVCAVLGAQWGDEGKGKLVDILAAHYDVIARFNGGSNAGHTLVVNGRKFAFHLLPCGMLYENKLNVIGNGVVLHVPTMLKELEKLHEAGIDTRGRLKISDRAHLLFDVHQAIDGRQEEALRGANIGTTKKGIGPCYSSKATRNGVRVGDLLEFDTFKTRFRALADSLHQQYGAKIDVEKEIDTYAKYRDMIGDMITDSTFLLNNALAQGKTVLVEGANAALLDIDHGTYPYVTSSATAAGGICTGLGIAPSHVQTTIGVVKAYTTRVGSGPFPTELLDGVGEQLRKVGHEFGTTTGRPRRCGWLDLPVVRYSHMLNNYASLNITKLDVLTGHKVIKLGVAYKIDGKRLPDGFMPSTLTQLGKVEVEYEEMPGWTEDISKCTDVSQLPATARAYLRRIEELTRVPISWVGVGAGRLEMATQGFQAKKL